MAGKKKKAKKLDETSQAALKLLAKLKFEGDEIEGEYIGTAGSRTAPGGYETQSWTLQDVFEFDPDESFRVRVNYACSGSGIDRVTIELPLESASEPAFKTGWMIVRGYLSPEVSQMNENARADALAASANPGAKGAIYTVIEALGTITAIKVAVTYPAKNNGWPRYSPLDAEEDLDELVLQSLSLEEAAKARDAAKAGDDYDDDGDDDDGAGYIGEDLE